MNKIIVSFFIAALFFLSPVHASTNLWSVTSQSELKNTSLKLSEPTQEFPTHIQQLRHNAEVVLLNKPLLRGLSVGDTIQLPIDNELYTVKFTEFKTHSNDSVTWYGRLNDGKNKLPVIITYGDTNFYVRAVTPTGTFVVSGSDMQGRLLQESLLDEVISFEKDDFLHPEDSQEYQKQQKIKKQIEQKKSKHQSTSDLKKTLDSHSNPESAKALLPKQTDTSSDSAIAEIDVLILYTPDVDTLYSGDPLTRINHLVAVTNQIYVDSGVQIHLNAVAVDLVNYTENVFSDAALRDITYQQKAFENVSIRRYEVGADMVILLRPYVDGDDACGIAWANGSNGSVKNSKHSMFSHTSIDCGDYVMAHELGHNMGLMHSRRQNGSGATFPFALGHGVDNEFTTVMAYEGVFSASKAYKFSNSSLDCFGLPCGIDRDDPVDGADAVYALNAIRSEIEAFYDPDPDLTLFKDAINEVSDINLKACFNSTNAYENFIFAAEFQSIYCSSQGVESLVGLDGFSGLKTVSVGFNNLTSLAGINSLTELTSLTASYNNITDVSALANLTLLNNLNLYSNQVEDISALANLTLLNNLNLYSNQVEDISVLANLTLLNSLNLYSNQVEDISALSNLINLEWLSLNNNNIHTLPSNMNMPLLSSLNIGYNNISDISPLGSLKFLTELDATYNTISDVSGVAELHLLNALKLDSNNITDISALSNLSNLVTLGLDHNQIEILPLDMNTPNLREIYAKDNNISDISGLAELTSLELISLNYNNISDITAIFDIQENIRALYIYANNEIPCWQINYARKRFFSTDLPYYCNLDFESGDYDGDGLTNALEVELGLDPSNALDANMDYDNDGLSNAQEIALGTNIFELDTDGDGISDGDEVFNGSDPLDSLSVIGSASTIVLVDDINNDSVKDWIEYRNTLIGSQVKLIDGRFFSTLNQYFIPHLLGTASVTLLSDRDSDGVNDIGVFGFDKGVNRYQLFVYSGFTGDKLGVWNWPATLGDVSFEVLSDLTGDGVEEYAISGVHLSNGTRQLVVKDGMTRGNYQTFKWPNQWDSPKFVVMTDITSDGTPEVAMHGKHERLDKGQLFMYDGANANNKLDVYNWNPLWDDISLHQMDDLDGDGTTDWGQFGKRKDDGRYQWLVKKGHDKRGVIRTFSWPSDLINVKPLLVSDRTEDNIREVAIVGTHPTTDKVFLRINDGRLANQRIANFSWPGNWEDTQVVELGDLNNDGFNEFALLGYTKTNRAVQVVVKDGRLTTEYGRYTLPGKWEGISLSHYDANNDGVEDIVISGISQTQQSLVLTSLNGKDLSLLGSQIIN
ncbi:MAG TPA: hypothetical protein ENH67_05765 [Pseudoalteromonas sp.]|uniref:Peptidase M12B domain-containing protein n=1 Tax=marine sediment metagenome TaxID=412755 RepID=A0A0F9UIT7_9ZZZZ|nr:leucine-rich repeat domain-containing protein [Pseudoalteromonas sp.]HDZ32377.1 hypothetical protein [Pseudoalteromonas sp.]